MGGSLGISRNVAQGPSWVREGDAWCVVPTEWLDQWRHFVGLEQDDNAGAGADSLSSAAESASGDGTVISLAVSQRPPPLDTRVLLQGPRYLELRPDVYEQTTFEVLPVIAWDAFRAWYSVNDLIGGSGGGEDNDDDDDNGSHSRSRSSTNSDRGGSVASGENGNGGNGLDAPAIVRYIVRRPSGELELELFPTFSTVYLADHTTGDPNSVTSISTPGTTSSSSDCLACSATEPLSSVKLRACRALGLVVRDTRLWIAEGASIKQQSGFSTAFGIGAATARLAQTFTSSISPSSSSDSNVVASAAILAKLPWVLADEHLEKVVEDVNYNAMQILLERRNPRTGRFPRGGALSSVDKKEPQSQQQSKGGIHDGMTKEEMEYHGRAGGGQSNAQLPAGETGLSNLGNT